MKEILTILLFVITLINLIFIGLFVMLKKRNLALGLAFLQILLVSLSSIGGL